MAFEQEFDLGIATAYAYAVSKGYTGTEEEFAALMASYATVAEEAEGYAEQAEAAKDLAESARNQAEEWASGSVGGDPSETNNSKYYSEQAADQASEAARQAGLADASAIAAGASEGAAAGSASTASTKAGEAAASATAAAGSATTASTKASEASASATAAASSKTAAQAAQTAAETAQGKAEDAQEAAEAAAEQAEATLSSYAKVDGSYSSMTVGNAEQLVATVGVEDSVPYNFRTSAGAADVGDRETDKLVGGTVAWNQIAKELIEGNYNKGAGTAVYDNGTVSFTAASRYGAIYGLTLSPLVNGHKYLINSDIKLTNVAEVNTVRVAIGHTGYNQGAVYVPSASPVNTFINVSGVVQYNPGTNPTYNYLFLQDNRAEVSQIDIKNLMLIDLTQMFGSTIADYIYSLETATPGAGVAWFRKLFPKPYYAYNPGELMSVQATAHKMVGFNQLRDAVVLGKAWANGEYVNGSNKQAASPQKVACVPGTTYCITLPNIVSSTAFYRVEFDAAGNFLRNAEYIMVQASTKYKTFTTSNDAYFIALYLYRSDAFTAAEVTDVNVNLSWDGERDGEYEPYQEWNYPLDDSLTLRGIPKLDSGNGLYYDGDTYESDGTVTRRYGVVDLGTLNWTVWVNDANTFVANLGNLIASAPQYIVCSKYPAIISGTTAWGYIVDFDKVIYKPIGGSYLLIRDTAFTDAAVLKASLSGVYVVYELATPTTETVDPFQSPQIVDDFGTEEYVDAAVAAETRDVAVPVGHDTLYQANLRAKLEMSPDSPDGDGDYIVRQTNGQNEYVPLMKELPTAPTTEGTYHLKATVTSGGVTLTWEADT